MIYFDYAATSLFREDIFKYIYENLEMFNGNTESTHAYGRSAKKILERSRVSIAKSLNTDVKNIYFNSGASEGNNTILKMFDDKNILTTSIEHSSIANNLGIGATLLPISSSGIINVEHLKEKINSDTRLVSIQYVNNEVGTIQPVQEIGEYLKEHHPDIWYHVDAVQAYGHINIDVKKINCNSLTISTHKIGATKNFGILYCNRDYKPLIIAGDQEHSRRGGTGNTIGAYAAAKSYERMVEEREYILKLKNYFLERIKNSNINYEINGDIKSQAPHILNLYFCDYKTDFLLTYLDMHGVCVSSGSACKSGSHIPSKVVTNIYDENRAEHSIRFSFGYKNTFEEIDKTIEILGDIK